MDVAPAIERPLVLNATNRPRRHAASSLARSNVAWFAAGTCAVAAAMCFDVAVADAVRLTKFSPPVHDLFRLARLPGDYAFTVALALMLALRFKGRLRSTIHLLIITAAASGIAAVVKWCAGRSRPFRGPSPFTWEPFAALTEQTRYGANLGFPSGDATLAFATAALLAHAFLRARFYAFAWAIIVAITRVLQGAHYPADVVAGAFLGLTTVRFLAPVLARQQHRFDMRTSSARPAANEPA